MLVKINLHEPGIYHFDGEVARRLFSCAECHNSAHQKLMNIAREIGDLKMQQALQAEIERDQWSGAGFE